MSAADDDHERVVQISRSKDGSLGGTLIWLNLDDLANLGVYSDAEEIVYIVDNGRLIIDSANGADG